MRLSSSVNPQVNGSEPSFDAIFGNLRAFAPIGAGIRAWAQTTRHRTEVPIAPVNKYWVESPVSTLPKNRAQVGSYSLRKSPPGRQTMGLVQPAEALFG